MTRYIFYSEHTKRFTDGCEPIDNIYREVEPNFIYLLFRNKEETSKYQTLRIRDRKGQLTELMILPF